MFTASAKYYSCSINGVTLIPINGVTLIPINGVTLIPINGVTLIPINASQCVANRKRHKRLQICMVVGPVYTESYLDTSLLTKLSGTSVDAVMNDKLVHFTPDEKRSSQNLRNKEMIENKVG